VSRAVKPACPSRARMRRCPCAWRRIGLREDERVSATRRYEIQSLLAVQHVCVASRRAVVASSDVGAASRSVSRSTRASRLRCGQPGCFCLGA
jgi:hypothetical protein